LQHKNKKNRAEKAVGNKLRMGKHGNNWPCKNKLYALTALR